MLINLLIIPLNNFHFSWMLLNWFLFEKKKDLKTNSVFANYNSRDTKYIKFICFLLFPYYNVFSVNLNVNFNIRKNK